MEDVTCNVDINSRVGVLGANGVGKSTLIQLLVGMCMCMRIARI